MLESKLSTGTSRTKRLHQDKFAFSLFWMSQCVACSPAWWILYHVTASCKGPITRYIINTRDIKKSLRLMHNNHTTSDTVTFVETSLFFTVSNTSQLLPFYNVQLSLFYHKKLTIERDFLPLSVLTSFHAYHVYVTQWSTQ